MAAGCRPGRAACRRRSWVRRLDARRGAVAPGRGRPRRRRTGRDPPPRQPQGQGAVMTEPLWTAFDAACVRGLTALAHFLWQGSAVALAVALALLALRRSAAS